MKFRPTTYRRYGALSRALLLALGLTFAIPSPAAVEADSFTQGWYAYNEQRYSEALNIWLPIAREGNASAQINLGVMFDEGKGVTKNPAEAVHWYRAAAQQNLPAAQFNLALMYAEGRGVAQDFSQAAVWYEKAANSDVVLAQFNLGMLLVEGRGIQQDLQAAYQWLDRAAQQDLADAQYNLAALYVTEGDDKLRQQALELYYRAGLNYLKNGDEEAALFAADSIRKVFPGHEYAHFIENRSSLKQTKQDHNASMAPLSGFSAGTAWPVARGYAITNNHVVADVTEVVLIIKNGEQLVATVVLRDEANDIALLSVKDKGKLPPALPLSQGRVRLGTDVFTIGFPRIDIMGRTPKLTDGIISSINGLRDDPQTLQISVPIQPGNSGGPLLNMKGEVVGVVASMLGSTDTITGATQLLSNVNYAIKIDVVRSLLPLLPKEDFPILELPVGERGLADLADQIQDSVMIVMAW